MQSPETINATVQAALAFIGTGNRREALLDLYLKVLEQNPSWSEADIQRVVAQIQPPFCDSKGGARKIGALLAE